MAKECKPNPVRDAGGRAAADLGRALAVAGGTEVFVATGPAMGEGGYCLRVSELSPVLAGVPSLVVVGADLRGDRLAGVLAHEVGHAALPASRMLPVLTAVRRAAVWCGVVCLAAGWWIPQQAAARGLLVVAAVLAVCRLVVAAVHRREEHQADARAVELLTAVGMDGRAATLAALEPEVRAARWADRWWPLLGHPSPASRYRRVARGR